MLKGFSCPKAGRWIVSAAAVALLVLVACSEIPPNTSETRQANLYRMYAGPPISGFTNFGRLNSWAQIDRFQLVVWATNTRAYLITVRPPCVNLPFATSIGLTQSTSRVSANFDSVVIGRERCWIQTIQEIDVQQMRQAMRQQTADANAAAQAAAQQQKQ